MDDVNLILEFAKLGLIPVCVAAVYFLWREYKLMVNGRIEDLKLEAAERENARTIVTR